jgi:hypothetical protein
MKSRVVNGNLVVELPLESPRRSSSGKTMVVASSRGPRRTATSVRKQTVWLVASAYFYPKNKKLDSQKSKRQRSQGNKKRS